MQAYYNEKGKNLNELTDEELKEIVFYHIIDGERHNAGAYFSRDFIDGAIDTENMVGRYIYTSLPAGSPIWSINKTASIITSDLEMGNGVVHIVNKVLEGNNDLLPDLIESGGRYSIFAQALRATNLRDSMLQIEDKSYIQPTTLPHNGAANTPRDHYPERKKYGYTALVESDSILKLREKIESLDGLRAYAKRVYDEMYPDDADITDETNPKNSLNRFVAYHLIPAKIRSDRFITTYGYVSEFDWFSRKGDICDDGLYTIEQYFVPMSPNTLISFQKGNIINEERNAYYNNLSNDDSAIRLLAGETDLDCQNGILHGINNMLIYDNHVESRVLHKRLRMEVRTFLPELINNEVVSYKNEYNQWHRYIPEGFCKNLEFVEERPNVYMVYHAANVHPYLYGDELEVTGFFDVKLTIGPVPAGKYEVRWGYHVSAASRGITQFYLDGEPCGIPVDMRLRAGDAGMGWEQDYVIAQMLGNSGGNPNDPDGYENDKHLRTRGFMKAPDSYIGTVYYNNTGGTNTIYSARNSDLDMRRILGIVNWTEGGTHELHIVQMLNGNCLLDYIEFMPLDLIDTEDTH
jgi:hypothetical protein